MPDWKPLPDGLDPDLRNLVEHLRRFKDSSGLSLAALAERTKHSKSAWARYVNGKTLPPREAVESLGQIVGTDPARLSALWELAEQAWSGRVAPGRQEQREPEEQREPAKPPEPARQPEPAAAGHPPVRRARPLRGVIGWIVAAAVPVLAVGTTAIALRLPGPGGHASPGTAPDRAQTAEAGTKQLRTDCFRESCTGKDPRATGCAGDAWTAALSRTHGVYVELRYSDSCAAAWARISWGGVGDIAEVLTPEGVTRRDHVHYDTDVYTPMVASSTPSGARACTTLTSGVHGCTERGGTVRLNEPPEPPVAPSPRAR